MKAIIYINKINKYYNIFFKNFMNRSISVKRVEKASFLNLRYRKKDLVFEIRNSKEENNIMVWINVKTEK